MEVVDSSRMQVMDDADSAVNLDSVASSAPRGGADLLNASRDEETADNYVDNEDNASVRETATNEDVTGAVVHGKVKRPASVTIMEEESMGAADVTGSRGMETDDRMDESARGDSNESDGDSSTNETACLEAMTPDGHDFYLRLGDTPMRRSALRLSRIIARQQLLRRLAQGRHTESCDGLWWYDLDLTC